MSEGPASRGQRAVVGTLLAARPGLLADRDGSKADQVLGRFHAAPGGRNQDSISPRRVALWTQADSVTRFDDLAIRTLP